MRKLFGILLISVALAACGAQEPTAPPQQVEVTLTEFAIEASETSFEAGQAYEFVITNEGAIAHEFVILPPLGEEASEDSHAHGHSEALAEVTEDDLPPGETVTITVTFPESTAGDELEFACHIAGHYEADMRQGIVVE